jgi:hypothetical protein
MMRLVWRIWTFLSIALALALNGCGFQREKDLASQAAVAFHHQLALGADDAIYNSATDHFRQTTEKKVVLGYFARIRRKMGQCTSSRSGAPGVLSSPSTGTFITATFRTSCANGELRESFVRKIMENGAKLDQYSAGSQLLLTD